MRYDGLGKRFLKSLLDGPVLSDGQIIGRASIYGVCTDERHPTNIRECLWWCNTLQKENHQKFKIMLDFLK